MSLSEDLLERGWQKHPVGVTGRLLLSSDLRCCRQGMQRRRKQHTDEKSLTFSLSHLTSPLLTYPRSTMSQLLAQLSFGRVVNNISVPFLHIPHQISAAQGFWGELFLLLLLLALGWIVKAQIKTFYDGQSPENKKCFA